MDPILLLVLGLFALLVPLLFAYRGAKFPFLPW
jgi:hypothetical protein